MGIDLLRGGNVSLAAHAPDVHRINVEMGWNVGSVQTPIDLDVSAFLTGENGKVRNENDFIFYNNPVSPEGAVRHTGGTLNAQGIGLDLSALPVEITCVAFVLTIHEAESRKQNFSMLQSTYIRLINPSNHTEIARYEINDGLFSETAIIVGELYRHKEAWKFRAVGQGYKGGLPLMAEHFGVDISEDRAVAIEEEETKPNGAVRKRRSQGEIIVEKVRNIKEKTRSFLPLIKAALDRSDNESGTRLILDRILQDILGYQIGDIKPEQRVQGRKADYVLSVENRDVIVIETKRIGTPLKDRQIFQATAYGAYAGIRWALLTNMTSWQLYRVSTADKVEANLVFNLNLNEDMNDRDAFHLYLISREGIQREAWLEKVWMKVKALSYASLSNTILSDDVITRIRNILIRENGCSITHDEVRSAIERTVFQLE